MDSMDGTQSNYLLLTWMQCSVFVSLPLLLLYGCSSDGGHKSYYDHNKNAINLSGEPTEDSNNNKLYIRTDRYSLVDASGSAAQQNPLRSNINISLGDNIVTVGEAVIELLRGSGYEVRHRTREACQRTHHWLFDRALPLSLRTLGPTSIDAALRTLIGKAWNIKVSELGRNISFYVRPEYKQNNVLSIPNINSGNIKGRYRTANAHSRLFIPFESGEFYNVSERGLSNLDKAAAQIKKLEARVTVRGHSHSSGDWATYNQALRRAITTQENLIDRGIDPEKIRLDVSVSNRNDNTVRLLHGAEVFLYTESASAKVFSQKYQNCNRIASNAVGDEYDAAIVKESPTFLVKKGSLRKNVERLLDELGLRMGKWDLADGRYEYDWEIPHSYSIAMSTPDEALRSMLGSYNIQPILNLLDNSVDFMPRHKPVSSRP